MRQPTTEVALVEDGVALMRLNHVRQARAWIAGLSDVAEIADVAEKARLAREVLKITKEAESLSRETLRLQCEALRRLVLLGDDLRGVNKACRGPARWLAKQSDAQFAELMRSCDPWCSLTTLYGRSTGAGRQRRKWDQITSNGRPSRPVMNDGGDLAAAAKVVLLHLAEQGEEIRTADAALALADELGIPRDEIDEIKMQGLSEIIRNAILRPDDPLVIRINGREVHCPPFVTYQEEEFGWVRVPWGNATLYQLEFMAQFRERQVAEMARASADLNLLVQEGKKKRTKGSSAGRSYLRDLFPRPASP